MSVFLNRESNEKRMSEREDHCRKAADHFTNLSNNYEAAKLKMMEYKFGEKVVPDVLAFHEKIIQRRKARMQDAETDVDRCIRMYNDQRLELAASLQNESVQEEHKDDTDRDDGSRGEGGSVKSNVDSDVSLLNQDEVRDITEAPTDGMVAASEREMAMEE